MVIQFSKRGGQVRNVNVVESSILRLIEAYYEIS